MKRAAKHETRPNQLTHLGIFELMRVLTCKQLCGDQKVLLALIVLKAEGCPARRNARNPLAGEYSMETDGDLLAKLVGLPRASLLHALNQIEELGYITVTPGCSRELRIHLNEWKLAGWQD
jgi:hypothetical protein